MKLLTTRHLLGQGAGVGKLLITDAEIGIVDQTIVAVAFNKAVLASNYATGVTITVNGAGATITTADRQASLDIVYFALSAPVVAGDTVTLSYNAAVGDYSNLSATKLLASITARTVTNNLGGSMAGYYMGCLGLTYSS